MTSRFSSEEAATFYLSLIILSIATWPVSFSLGAYGEVFYREVLVIWVASVAALLGSIIIGRTENNENYFTWWGSILLLVPTLLMFSTILGIDELPAFKDTLEWILLIGALPYIGFILISIVVPETMEIKSRKLQFWLVICIILINGASYFIGYNNEYFFTCEEFRIAGDTPPDNCWSRSAN